MPEWNSTGNLQRLFSMEDTENRTDFASIRDGKMGRSHEDPEQDWYNSDVKILLLACSILGVFVSIGNIFILYASKYASGGRSPTLVFIRSLCVADSFSGIFAILKTFQVGMFSMVAISGRDVSDFVLEFWIVNFELFLVHLKAKYQRRSLKFQN